MNSQYRIIDYDNQTSLSSDKAITGPCFIIIFLLSGRTAKGVASDWAQVGVYLHSALEECCENRGVGMCFDLTTDNS